MELYVPPIHTEDEIDVLHNFILIFISAVTICICSTFVINFFFFFCIKVNKYDA